MVVTAGHGEAHLQVNGKTYTLTLKMAGLMALQKRLSPPGSITKLDKVLPELERAITNQSLEHLVVLVWAAMQKHHPGTTEQDALNLIDDAGGMVGLAAAFEELKDSIIPDPDDANELVPAGASEKRVNPQRARVKK